LRILTVALVSDSKTAPLAGTETRVQVKVEAVSIPVPEKRLEILSEVPTVLLQQVKLTDTEPSRLDSEPHWLGPLL
jgi:hypothetical protein